MQRFLRLIPLMLSITVFAQFPPPQNFNYQLEYFEIDQWGECNGQFLAGPSYCSNFRWSLPDTSLTEALLTSYEIYNILKEDTLLIHALSDTLYITTTPYEGDLFAVAVYSDPSGKSGPSNMVNNPGIPISISETNVDPDFNIKQFPGENWLTIEAYTTISRIKIFDLNGHLINDKRNVNLPLYIGHLKPGVYIIEIRNSHNKSARTKFIKIGLL